MVVLVTGGARSGKSSFAEKYVHKLSKNNTGIYLATSEVLNDDEMRERVEHHQKRRESSFLQWEAIEEPRELINVLDQLQTRADVRNNQTPILVDCLTLWLTNMIFKYEDKNTYDLVIEQINKLIELLKNYKGVIIFVTNEVGYGIVPEYPLGRLFRDLSGIMNQRVASVCDQVFLVTSGIPIELKSIRYHLD